MKNLFVFFSLLVSVCIFAQQPKQKLSRKQKRYIKTVQQLDVLQYLPDKSDQNPSTFWISVVKNNTKLQKELEVFNNPKGLAAAACEKEKRAFSDMALYNMSYRHDKEEEINQAFKSVMLGDDFNMGNIKFRIEGSNELNACTVPGGYIYIYNGLLKALNGNYTMVNGVLAHEVTHHLFQHLLLHEYKTLRRERVNNIVATISIAAIGAANMVGAANGAPQDTASQRNTYKGIIDGAKEWTEAFYYRYGREKEFEADIVAYRFLEWIGLNPNDYIKTLEIIGGPWIGRETDKYDDHPSAEDRIGVLRALTPAPWRVDK